MPLYPLPLSLEPLFFLFTFVVCSATFEIQNGDQQAVLLPNEPNAVVITWVETEVNLQCLHEINLAEDRSAVWLDTGLRWGTVYHALDTYDLTVAGGRDGDVGVGGYILGGGMSWHANQVGWVCDNVLEFEVVVGNGSILRASATQHTDLFWALKGSGSVFGIVARFKLPTIKGTEVWAGGIQYAEDKIPELFRTLQDQGSITSTKTRAFGYLSFVWSQKTRQYVRSAFAIDTSGQSNSTIIKRWEAVPYSMESLGRSSIARMADGSNSENLRGFRGSKFTITIRNSAAAMLSLYQVYQKTLQSIELSETGYLAFVLQPISVAQMQASAKSGKGNAFNLSPHDGPLVLVFVELTWIDLRKDQSMEMITKRMHDEMEATLIEPGDLHRWIYPNYAAGWQNPFSSLDNTTRITLKEAQKIYDSDNVMGRLQPGAFHL